MHINYYLLLKTGGGMHSQIIGDIGHFSKHRRVRRNFRCRSPGLGDRQHRRVDKHT